MGTFLSGGAQFRFASDQALLVDFEHADENRAAKRPAPLGHPHKSEAEAHPRQNQITLQSHEQVRKLLRLMELEPIPGVRNLHPAYCSILIKFDAIRLRHEDLERILRGYLERMEAVTVPEPRLVEIPVCYGGEFGPDLKDVADLHGITPGAVVELHAATTYVVYFLGFAPGFAYLGELPEKLVTPRLATPRRVVPAGSVGIAGRQTGVYPISTPGGWRLLGRTPVTMFQPERARMSLLSIGDRVRFVAISPEKFLKP
jgi:inhibitor of KinA